MAVQTEFNADGAALTDEPVKCHLSVVINAVTYYYGYLMEMSDDSVLGNSDPDYGAWTATGEGGTRYTVLSGGVPGANECVINKTTGRVLVTTLDQVLYFRYIGYGRLFQWFDERTYFSHDGLLDFGSTTELGRVLLPYGMGIARIVGHLDGAPSGGTLILTIAKVAGEGSETATVTFSSGSAEIDSGVLSSRLKYQPGEHLTVSVPSNTRGAVNLSLHIYPG